LGQPRGTQRYRPTQRADEDALTQAIVTLASQYGRYGYRRITALLQRAGWKVGKDRVERIWRREGLKVPKRQKPRGRLWLNDGSCVRLRPTHVGHVWSYDFVSARTHDGRVVRMLNLIDEHTRECLLIRTCAKLCHVNDGELEQIQFLLGHVSVLTTERYLGCKQNLEERVNDRFGCLFASTKACDRQLRIISGSA
jgi:hypothetical protein